MTSTKIQHVEDQFSAEAVQSWETAGAFLPSINKVICGLYLINNFRTNMITLTIMNN